MGGSDFCPAYREDQWSFSSLPVGSPTVTDTMLFSSPARTEHYRAERERKRRKRVASPRFGNFRGEIPMGDFQKEFRKEISSPRRKPPKKVPNVNSKKCSNSDAHSSNSPQDTYKHIPHIHTAFTQSWKNEKREKKYPACSDHTQTREGKIVDDVNTLPAVGSKTWNIFFHWETLCSS